jgi:hypothetical protein
MEKDKKIHVFTHDYVKTRKCFSTSPRHMWRPAKSTIHEDIIKIKRRMQTSPNQKENCSLGPPLCLCPRNSKISLISYVSYVCIVGSEIYIDSDCKFRTKLASDFTFRSWFMHVKIKQRLTWCVSCFSVGCFY